ncbi:hypothetical protein ACFLSV_05650 [Bacteroidota bacterium]
MSLIIETNSFNIEAKQCDKIVLLVNKGAMLHDVRAKSGNKGVMLNNFGAKSGDIGIKLY